MSEWRASLTRPRRLSWLLVAVVTAGCGPDVRTISVENLAAHMAEGKAGQVFHLVDLRPPRDFARGHLPGARSVPYALLAIDLDLFTDGKPVIFYDDREPDVQRIGKALGSRLPPNVVALEGGYRAWIGSGRPLKGSPR